MGLVAFLSRGSGAKGRERSARRAGTARYSWNILRLACCLSASLVPAAAHARLQCVPFAREQSGIAIFGNASTWWSKADGVYAKGSSPREGAVLAMAASQAMPVGHVAVVSKVVDSRHILLDHANWSSPGIIERGVLAEDVSAAGDWSAVRVWYGPSKALGRRVNAVRGFIYPVGPAVQFEFADQASQKSETIFKAFDRALPSAKRSG